MVSLIDAIWSCDFFPAPTAAGPWMETYRVGLKIPSVLMTNSSKKNPVTPLFVNFVVSVHVDAELMARETQEVTHAREFFTAPLL
jgi:hypothetical protein